MFALACGGSQGTIDNRTTDQSFIRAKDGLYFVGHRRLKHIRLDGSEERAVFPPAYSVLDRTTDGSLFALGDSETNLFLGNPATGVLREVTEIRGRAGVVSFSPDGRTLAVVKHSDFALPQSAQKSSDAVYLVDTRALSFRVFAKHTAQITTQLKWSSDGTFFVLSGHTNSQRITADTGVREVIPVDNSPWGSIRPLNHFREAREKCGEPGHRLELKGFKGDDGIILVDHRGNGRPLVTVKGRKRGFHDYHGTIRSVGFSESCEYARFTFRDELMVVEVSTGKVTAIAKGVDPFWGELPTTSSN